MINRIKKAVGSLISFLVVLIFVFIDGIKYAVDILISFLLVLIMFFIPLGVLLYLVMWELMEF